MKKILFLMACILWLSPLTLFSQDAHNPNKCGMEIMKAALIAGNPVWAQRIEDQRNSLQGIADAYQSRKEAERLAGKTTSVPTIPIIFHVLVTYSQYIQLGGTAGIAQRVDSQIAVLNRDYNAQNADSIMIPTGWKHLYANVGIQFGLAHTNPYGTGTPGYEISIIPDAPGGFSSASNSYSNAKHSSSGGFDAWDVTKYINVWCINPVDVSGLLGLTVARSFTTSGGYPTNEIGICINYATLGKRASASDYYIPGATTGDYYDQGRTLTHELGHLFEIWHTWGDDGGLCPWDGGKDDGIQDTPPESGAKFDNTPYSITGGTYYDTCRYDGAIDTQLILLGVPSLDYMNYTDDIGMHMFTKGQANVMNFMVASGGESYSLTQNPGLLLYSSRTSVPQVDLDKSLNISPNPSNGLINISFNCNEGVLNSISIVNILGQEVMNKDTRNNASDYYSIDLSGMSKGIYLVKCNFASGSITRKILLQ